MLILLLVLLSLAFADKAPTEILLRNSEGEVVSSISFTKWIHSGKYSVKCDLQDVYWSISPTLPKGIEFSYFDQTISGIALEEVSMKMYTITATNNAGSISISVPIDVHYCEEGFYIIRIIRDVSEVNILVKRGEQVIEQTHALYDSKIVYYCLPVGPLIFKMECISSGNEKCFASISYTNQMTYLRLFIPQGELQRMETSMIPSSPPTLELSETEVITMIGEPISISILFPKDMIFHSIEFFPPLPSSLIFDDLSLSIRGSMKTKANSHSLFLP